MISQVSSQAISIERVGGWSISNAIRTVFVFQDIANFWKGLFSYD